MSEHPDPESLPTPLLEDDALDRLDDFLASDQVGEDALDLISAHGFMVALALVPSETPDAVWLQALFDGVPDYTDAAERDEIETLLGSLRDTAVTILEQGGRVELPFELTLDGMMPADTPIGDWCAGFMEGVFCHENAWFGEDEETAATLLLPFMVLSGLFDDEPDIAELSQDSAQLESMVTQLAELVLDLYLHYRVPVEKPRTGGASGRKGGPGRQR